MRYDPKKIEAKWQKKWLADKTYEPSFAPTVAKAMAGKKATEGKPSRVNAKRKPFYNLMMFPYPSAEGLHVGNMYAFTGSDIYGRLKRMQGYDVFEPIGLDGFGINSENYALKTKRHPMTWAKISEKNFYRQLAMIGCGFSWNEHLETYDPEYYQWTQWIFVQMFKRGLAYRKKQAVNWCPSCKTVLADEQVLPAGRQGSAGACERCGTVVVKKELEQWFFRITKYADRLLKNLEKLDWSERVKIAQKNWIGKSEGAMIKFPISPRHSDLPVGGEESHQERDSSVASLLQNDQRGKYIEVFTTRPDTLFGATYLVVAPEHEFIENLKSHITNYREVAVYAKKARAKAEMERIAEEKEKTGVEVKGIRAVNPANNEEIPIFVADYVLGGYGTGAIMAVPAHDDRDFDFAKKYQLPIIYVNNGKAIRVYGSLKEQARIIELSDEAFIKKGKIGSYSATKFESEWIHTFVFTDKEYEREFLSLIKRMEFQYEDVPYTRLDNDVITMNSGNFNGVDSKEAKWKITEFVRGKRVAQYHLRDWLLSRQRYWGPPIPMIFCEACAAKQKGERTDMPGWYAVPEKDLPVKLPFVKNFRPTGTDQSPLAAVKSFARVQCPRCRSWARRETDVLDTFLDSAWYFLRYPSVRNKKVPWDPAITKKWLPVNVYIGGAEHSVLHLMYSRFLTMAFHDAKLLSFEEPFPKFRAHGLITKDGAKMSKSKGNVVNPDDYIHAYGADAVRMYLAFMAPFEQGGDFRDTGIRGMTRFLERVWRFITVRHSVSHSCGNPKLQKALHRAIKKVTDDIENLQYNTAISALMVLLNECEAHADAVTEDDLKIFLKLLAPFAPHITEELWQQSGNRKSEIGNQRFQSIHREAWPKYDARLIKEETFDLVMQINGKTRAVIEIKRGISREEAVRLAMSHDAVKRNLTGEAHRIIFVPDKLINFVVQ